MYYLCNILLWEEDETCVALEEGVVAAEDVVAVLEEAVALVDFGNR